MDASKEVGLYSPLPFLSIRQKDPSEAGAFILESSIHNHLLDWASLGHKSDQNIIEVIVSAS